MVIARRLAIFAAMILAAQGEEPEGFVDAAQDGEARIWAITRATPPALLVSDAADWKPAPMSDGPLGAARFVAPHPDGAILIVWDDGHDCAVTEHRGTTGRLLGRLGARIADFERLNVFVDSRANVWLSQPLGTIHRITPAGEARQLYQVPQEKMIGLPPLRDATPRHDDAPLLAAEDGRGHIWFWTFSHGHGPAMRGLLVWDGKNFVHHERLAGLHAEARFSALVRKDDHHLWLTVDIVSGLKNYQSGLLELDTVTLGYKVEPVPEEDAFSHIERLFIVGDDLYALADGWTKPTVLWRRRSGKWEALTSDLSRNRLLARHWEQPCHFASQGILLTDGFQPLRFLPKDGGNFLPIDWRNGFYLRSTKRLFALPNGNYFALSHDGTFHRGPLELSPKPAPAPRVSIALQEELPALVRGRAEWGAMARRDPNHQQPYDPTPLPPEFRGKSVSLRLRDRDGTFWFLLDRQLYKARDGRAVCVFDPDERHPFLDGRMPRDLGVEADGSALFRTIGAGRWEYVAIRPRYPRPRTEIAVGKIIDDTAELTFSNRERGGGHFTWRLNGGEWSVAQNRVKLESLRNGEHEVEVVCTNDELLREAAPTKARWTIAVDHDAIARALVAQLKTGNASQRETAVAGLAKRPEAARAALKTARDGANEEQLWWIEAATQEVERTLSRGRSQPKP